MEKHRTDTLVKQISISRGSVATRSSAGTNVIKTMILVSAFYVICHLLQAVLYIDMTVGTNRLAGVNYVACISRFIQFLYVTTNPFIYAIKFDPVRKVLKEMISRRTRRNVVMSHPGASASRMTAVWAENANKDQTNLAKGGTPFANPVKLLFVFARWGQQFSVARLLGVGPQIFSFLKKP